MSVAGPSRALPPGHFAPSPGFESTYEQDLQRLLDRLSLDERDEFQASWKRRISAGGRLSDHEVALNDLIQQARELAALEQDRMLAERIAVEEDSDVDVDQTPMVETETMHVDPEPKGKRARKKRKKRNRKQQQGEVDQSGPQPNERTETEQIGNQQNDVVPSMSAWARGPRPLPDSKIDTTGKGKGKEQIEVLPSRSAWARSPPPPLSSLAASIQNQLKKTHTRKDAKGKGKEHPGVQVAGSGTVPRWQIGETLPSSFFTTTKEPLAFGSLPLSETAPKNTASVVPKAPKVKRPTGHDCVICQDPIYGAEIHAPCDHYYDIGCITDLFKAATRDETLFPPRCCKKTIPFTQVQPHLSRTLIATFQEKKTEFSTLKRVYCSFPTCSQFLGPLSEGDSASKVYTCPASGCERMTCAKCREQHSGHWTHVCRPDAGATQVLELSQASGWARCPGCAQMIELNFGCFHMTCRCRTEFCYLCRARWKTCRCVQWDEERLYSAAEQRVNAQLGQQARPAPAPAPPRGAAAARNPFAILDEQPAVPARRPEPAPAAATTRPAGRLSTTSSSDGRNTAFLESASTLDWAQDHGEWDVQSSDEEYEGWGTPPPEEEYADWGAPPPDQEYANWGAPPTGEEYAGWGTPPDEEYADWGAPPEEEYADWGASPADMDAVRERMIHEMMERLREDHDCDHIHWRYQDDGGYCDSCGDHLPLYLFRCRDCEMLACNRCRRNRL